MNITANPWALLAFNYTSARKVLNTAGHGKLPAGEHTYTLCDPKGKDDRTLLKIDAASNKGRQEEINKNKKK
jgi:hypothetical protein